MTIPSFDLYIEEKPLSGKETCKGKLTEFYKGLMQKGIQLGAIFSSSIGYKTIYIVGDVDEAVRFANEFGGFKARNITRD